MNKRERNFIAPWIGVAIGIALFGMMLPEAKATGNAPVSPTTSALATATSGPVSATGGAVQTGDVAVGGYQSKAWAIGGSGLAASANACQGSVNIALLAFTFDVVWCRTLEKARAMHNMAPSDDAEKAMLCLDEEIRSAYAKTDRPCK